MRVDYTDINEKAPLTTIIQLGGIKGPFAISPDGNYIAIGDGMAIRIWNIQGKIVRVLEDKLKENSIVTSVAFDRTGRRIAGAYTTQTNSGSITDGYVKLWSVEGQCLMTTTDELPGINRVRFSPDDTRIAASTNIIHPLGDTAVCAVVEWDLKGAYLREMVEYDNLIHDFIYLPGGRRIAAAMGTAPFSPTTFIGIFGESNRIENKLTGQESSVETIEISNDGAYIAASSILSIKVWTADGVMVKTLRPYSGTNSVSSLAFHPEKNILYFTSAKGIQALDLDAMNVRVVQADQADQIAFFPDGTKYMARHGELAIMNAAGEKIDSIQSRAPDVISDLALAGDRSAFIVMSGGSVWIYDITGRFLASFNPHMWDTSIRFGGNDRFILVKGKIATNLSGSSRRLQIVEDVADAVRCYDRSGNFIREYPGTDLFMAQDGTAFAVSGGNLTEFDPGGKTVRSFHFSFTPDRVCANPDMTRFAAGRKDRLGAEIRGRDGGFIATVNFDGEISDLMFGPDNTLISIDERFRTISMWDRAGVFMRSLSHPDFTSPDSIRLDREGKHLRIHARGRVFSVDGSGRIMDSKQVDTHADSTLLLDNSGSFGLEFSRGGKDSSEDNSVSSEAGRIIYHNLLNEQTADFYKQGTEWVLFTHDGYFDCSNNGGHLIGIAKGMQVFGVDQVAVQRNRPDIILKRLGIGTHELIDDFKKQHIKRLIKSGLSPAEMATAPSLPETMITSMESTDTEMLLAVRFTDRHFDLTSYNIYVNDVPLFAFPGRPLTGRKWSCTERIPLTGGINKIEVSCKNKPGYESYRAQTIVNNMKQVTGDLYYIGFGVSRYARRRLNLEFADRDARDLDEIFKSMKGVRFTDVHTLTLTNDRVTVESIRKAKDFLKDATENDTVVLFITGHGMHDDKSPALYYYLTHEADPKELDSTAAPFEHVEGLLQAIKPRKKLFLMDTCESGELDDDIDIAGLELEEKIPGLKGRRARLENTKGKRTRSAARANMIARDRYIYSDLFRRSGAIVFSSCRGDEVSYEHQQFANGLFTEAMLRAVSDMRADRDRDGLVSTDEFRSFVMGEVPRLCRQVKIPERSIQHPTVDRDNLFQKFKFPLLDEKSMMGPAVREGNTALVKQLIEKKVGITDADGTGLSPLQVACRNGDREMVKVLVEAGADVNKHEEFTQTALEYAASGNHTEIVAFLISRGADVNLGSPLTKCAESGAVESARLLIAKGARLDDPGFGAMGPLHTAAFSGQMEMARLLVESGAEISVQNYGITPLTYALSQNYPEIARYLISMGCILSNVASVNFYRVAPLHQAVENDDMETARMIIDRGVKLNIVDGNGETALHKAAGTGNLALVRLLVEHGADTNIEGGLQRYDQTPLDSAVSREHPEVCAYLLDHGARIVPRTVLIAVLSGNEAIVRRLIAKGADFSITGRNGNTPLHLAAARGHKQVVRALLEKAPGIAAKNDNGDIPLHSAARCRYSGGPETCTLLIDKGSDINAMNNEEKTPLACALEEGNDAIIKILMGRGGLLNSDGSASSPLHLAARVGDISLMKRELARGAGINDPDSDRMSPLHMAVKHKQLEAAKYLLKNGASPLQRFKVPPSDLDFFGSERETQSPAESAVESGYVDMVRLFLDSGVSPDEKDRYGDSLLHRAVSGKQEDVARLLIKKGADVNAVNKKNETPLFVAARYDDEKETRFNLGKLLLESGADPNIRSSEGDKSPLIDAVDHNMTALVELLLKYKADPNVKTSSGNTPLFESYDNPYLASLLLDNGADLTARDSEKKTPLLRAALPVQALLIERGADIKASDGKGDTILHHLVREWSLPAFRFALSKGADINARNKNGDTPLNIVAQSTPGWDLSTNAVEIIQHLLSRGADFSIANNEGKAPADSTGLLFAAVSGTGDAEYNLVKAILTRKTPSLKRDTDGASLIHLAATPRMIDLLLKKGLSINSRNSNGETPLHVWCGTSNYEQKEPINAVISALIERGADVNARDAEGLTPLHRAIFSGNIECVHRLLAKGARSDVAISSKSKPKPWRDDDGSTILHKAAGSGITPEDMRILIKQGNSVLAANSEGDTPLHVAARSKNAAAAKTLISAGARTAAKNNSGETAYGIDHGALLFSVIETGAASDLEFFLGHGARIETKDEYGNTLLMSAVNKKRTKIVKLLMKKGAAINAVDNYGYTALHHAIYKYDAAMAKLLVGYGADVNRQDNAGDTPLHIAADRDVSIVRLLLEHGARKDIVNKKGLRPADLATTAEAIRLMKGE